MCSKTFCNNCGKATWQGCGMHVTCALYGVDEKDRCPNWKGGVYKPCETRSSENNEFSKK
eukprot:CCRYP_000997-RA/>CCRYP_000997-RA protein AED:0.34 eAED:0.34 QI:786/1/1/1/0.5/0.4/5/418/59